MNWAEKYVGIPFVDGGRTLEGLDCWGLVWMIYRDEFGVQIPALSAYETVHDRDVVANLLYLQRPEWETVEEPQPGNVVLMLLNGGKDVHVGLYLPGGKMLHVFQGRNCCVERLSSPMWRSSVRGFYRRVSTAR